MTSEKVVVWHISRSFPPEANRLLYHSRPGRRRPVMHRHWVHFWENHNNWILLAVNVDGQRDRRRHIFWIWVTKNVERGLRKWSIKCRNQHTNLYYVSLYHLLLNLFLIYCSKSQCFSASHAWDSMSQQSLSVLWDKALLSQHWYDVLSWLIN